MSLFLGKIHYWLYNKISWFEKIEEEIVSKTKVEGFDSDHVVNKVTSEFGAPTEKKPLEEMIDTSNIHGWLQQRITSAELRQAALVTEFLKQHYITKGQLIEIFARRGKSAAHQYEGRPETPEEIFNAINDFILEGMPCDRVNEVIENSDNEFTWRTTRCLHKPYWEQVGGDVQIFHDLREIWLEAFVESLNPNFKYEKDENDDNKIIRHH